jgi:hypothetical protein
MALFGGSAVLVEGRMAQAWAPLLHLSYINVFNGTPVCRPAWSKEADLKIGVPQGPELHSCVGAIHESPLQYPN